MVFSSQTESGNNAKSHRVYLAFDVDITVTNEGQGKLAFVSINFLFRASLRNGT